MHLPSFSSILIAVGVAYVAYTIYGMAQIFIAPQCLDDRKCLHSFLSNEPKLTLYVFSSMKSSPRTDADVHLISIQENFNYSRSWEKKISLPIPEGSKQNGSLHLNIVVVPTRKTNVGRWFPLIGDKEVALARIPLTQLHVPDIFIFNLLENEKQFRDNLRKEIEEFSGKSNLKKKGREGDVEALRRSAKPVSHLRTQVTFNMLTEPLKLPMDELPGDVMREIRLTKGMMFLPIIHYNFLETKIEHLKLMKNDTEIVTLKYDPIHIGKFRFIKHVEEAMKSLKQLGFSSKDIDDVKNIFAGTNLYLLSATIVIVSFHLLFDFLAFKNDVSFWRKKSSMEGLSSRTVLWRAFSQAVVFFYLMDEKASMIVLAPTAIAVLIELWKVLKVLKRRNVAEISESERMTDAYDAESMKYLSYVLYPLCIGGAIYSLMYQPHRSWYSWCIHSLVNGVYAFGFLFMLPQLFVNYRLKSVAALPWRAFMYKAFNTFIDDVFAFIITMPAAHRVACFRDDVIFLIYLYQRWLYPVDTSRLDESARQLGEKVEKKE